LVIILCVVLLAMAMLTRFLIAVTVIASGTTEFEKDPSVPSTAYIMNFCPPFFNKYSRLEVVTAQLKADPSLKSTLCNLNALDSTARIVLHEITQ